MPHAVARAGPDIPGRRRPQHQVDFYRVDFLDVARPEGGRGHAG